MSGTHTSRAPLTTYRDAVTELIDDGEKFGDVEDAIDDVPELTQDEKAALWLFAFSLRDPTEQQSDARGHIAALQSAGALQDGPMQSPVLAPSPSGGCA
jgi:hypothetical protein